jgi:MSHA biogenesis protein MshQ
VVKLLTFISGCILGFSSYAFACTSGINVKVDRVTLSNPTGGSSGPTTINFRQTYATAPLVFILPGNDNPDPATIRVLSVSTTEFQVGTAESEGENGISAAQTFNYLAIIPGSYNLGAGRRIQAGTVSTTQRQSGVGDTTGYATVNFSPSFGGTPPVMLHEIQSFANDPAYDFSSTTLTQPWLETISLQASVTGSSASVALERAETSAGAVSTNETIAYFAMSPGAGSFIDSSSNTINFNVFTTPTNITDNCINNAHGLGSATTIAIANQAARNGNNGGWLRLCGYRCNKSEHADSGRPELTTAKTGHTAELAAVAAFSQAFDQAAAGQRHQAGRWHRRQSTPRISVPASISPR